VLGLPVSGWATPEGLLLSLCRKGLNAREVFALPQPHFNEVHQDDGVSDHDPRSSDETDHAGCGEESAHRHMGGQDSNEEKGIADMMTKGVQKSLNQPTTRMYMST